MSEFEEFNEEVEEMSEEKGWYGCPKKCIFDDPGPKVVDVFTRNTTIHDSCISFFAAARLIEIEKCIDLDCRSKHRCKKHKFYIEKDLPYHFTIVTKRVDPCY